MSSLVGATMTASGSCSSLKRLAATPSAISCCRIGSRNAAWRREDKFKLCPQANLQVSCWFSHISPFYQIQSGHRPWDLCQQRWLGCRASAQGSASHNQTCWCFSSRTRTMLPLQKSEEKMFELLTRHHWWIIQEMTHAPASMESSHLFELHSG